jgi:ribosomal protein S18 acetylase RimI-like enzyme
MGEPTPIPLVPIPIALDSPEFSSLLRWPFQDSFVGRLLRSDIPQRVQFNWCRIWVSSDADSRLVGFGTLDLCKDYSGFTGGQSHTYIPLLAKNPTIKSMGFGTFILGHLISEAALIVRRGRSGWFDDLLFLDVYTGNDKAIGLYDRAGFVKVIDQPIEDPDEGGRGYFIMAKRVSIAARNTPLPS